MTRIEALQSVATRLAVIDQDSVAYRAELAKSDRDATRPLRVAITRKCDEVFAILNETFGADNAMAKDATDAYGYRAFTDEEQEIRAKANDIYTAAPAPIDPDTLAGERDAVVVLTVVKAMLSYHRASLDSAYSTLFEDFAGSYKGFISR